MKILIITTYYPPDTAIAAVRPYMFAKYLTRYGHEVTVLRSGEIRDGLSTLYKNEPSVRILSWLGQDAPAERYARGEALPDLSSQGASRLQFLPAVLRKPIAKVYHLLTRTEGLSYAVKQTGARVEKQKAVLDTLKQEPFDIVFSTFGQAENIYAGQYAAKLFDCPLIQDFRDPLATAFQKKKEYRFWKKVQDEAIMQADICTAVSQGVLQDICAGLPVKKAALLYNGYEPTEVTDPNAAPPAGQLSFCYTGQLYGGLRDFSPLLKALRTLSDEGKISLGKVRIHYAGKDFSCLRQQAEKLGISEILVDHGYVGRKEASEMQSKSDVFTVLSWNTTSARGILTGKFYEGIRAQKPILALVAGDIPYSELDLINEKYGYGFCYENCREKEQFQALCDYLEGLYREKMSAGSISYTPDPALETDFRYDTLSKKLEKLCFDVMGQKNSDSKNP